MSQISVSHRIECHVLSDIETLKWECKSSKVIIWWNSPTSRINVKVLYYNEKLQYRNKEFNHRMVQDQRLKNHLDHASSHMIYKLFFSNGNITCPSAGVIMGRLSVHIPSSQFHNGSVWSVECDYLAFHPRGDPCFLITERSLLK